MIRPIAVPPELFQQAMDTYSADTISTEGRIRSFFHYQKHAHVCTGIAHGKQTIVTAHRIISEHMYARDVYTYDEKLTLRERGQALSYEGIAVKFGRRAHMTFILLEESIHITAAKPAPKQLEFL